MFSHFNLNDFPFVNVTFENYVENDLEIDNFLESWLKIDNNNIDYNLIFDTRNIKFINPKYIFKIIPVMQKLRNSKKKYLKRTIIIVNSGVLRKLLELLFGMQKPISHVYIVDSRELADELITNFKKNVTTVPENVSEILST